MEMAEPKDSLKFFTGEGDRREERRVKKSQVLAERLAQMFGVSYDTQKAFQLKHVFLVNECYNHGKKVVCC